MDTCNNIDTSERSQTIECILCKSVSIKLQKCKLIDTDRKHTTGFCLLVGVGEGLQTNKETFGVMGMFTILISWMYTPVKIYQIVHSTNTCILSITLLWSWKNKNTNSWASHCYCFMMFDLKLLDYAAGQWPTRGGLSWMLFAHLFPTGDQWNFGYSHPATHHWARVSRPASPRSGRPCTASTHLRHTCTPNAGLQNFLFAQVFFPQAGTASQKQLLTEHHSRS